MSALPLDTADDRADAAVARLVEALKGSGYRFVTVTPATHERVNARPGNAWAKRVEDVFGWSRPFRSGLLPDRWMNWMHEAGVLEPTGDGWRATVRVSSLGDHLFVHSAWPTGAADAVFFGPDTYRFASAIDQHLATGRAVRRAVDIGCGAGPGAVKVALARQAAEVYAVDINPRALRTTALNAALAGATNVRTRRSDLLSGVAGEFDLIVANPPYLLDRDERTYRHGGGDLGEGLSLSIVDLAATSLAPGGTLLLYTGAAIRDGVDAFRDAVATRLAGCGLAWDYREMDPDVFGEELLEPAYRDVDRIAAVVLTIERPA